MKFTLTNKDKEKVINRIASHLRDRYDEIASAYIFGSFATSDSFSDIDVGIVLAKAVHRILDFEIELESQIEKITEYSVDVRVLNRAPISFSQSVFRNGRVILDKDPNLRADFEGRILKEYFDFAPFRRRYLEEVTNAPV